MVRLRVSEILQEQGKTEEWLFKQIGMTDYKRFRKLISNESSRIQFDTISRISEALKVPARELFTQIEDSDERD